MLSYQEILSLTYLKTIRSQHGTNIRLDIDILFVLPVGDRPIITFLKIIMKKPVRPTLCMIASPVLADGAIEQ